MMGKRQRAAVVVLGDLGRSPRMQYHALSLARQAGLEVDVVAFAGTEPHADLLQNLHIHLHLMRALFPQGLPRTLYLLLLPLKLILQFITLLWVLCVQIPAPDFILVQNPPSIPTLTVVRLACWLRKAAFVIDWHNFGYTLLTLSLGASHPLVKMHFWYERRYGKTANGYLCVTKAMQHELEQNWGIRATVVYDRSPEFFRPTSLKEKHELFCRLDAALTQPVRVRDCCGDGLVQASGQTNIVDGDALSGSKIFVPVKLELTGTFHFYKPHEGQTFLSCNWKANRSFRCSTFIFASAGPSTRKLLRGHQEAVMPQQSGSAEVGGESRDVLQGLDYVVPNIRFTLFTSHAIVDDIDRAETEIHEGDHYSYREGRPALIVSSTSWTVDEDFGILLEAALMYDRRVAALLGETDDSFLDRSLDNLIQSPFPRLLFVVTGKGPMRAKYEEDIRKLRLRRVAFRTMWLSADDYPRLLGAADLGVCLHTSSSGLDLPMKVVDMFGCGLPVCAVSYSCIGELVKDRQNGLLFSSSSELADQLLDLFKGFPNACDLLGTLRSGAMTSGSVSRWDDEWNEHVLPLLSQVAAGIKE